MCFVCRCGRRYLCSRAAENARLKSQVTRLRSKIAVYRGRAESADPSEQQQQLLLEQQLSPVESPSPRLDPMTSASASNSASAMTSRSQSALQQSQSQPQSPSPLLAASVPLPTVPILPATAAKAAKKAGGNNTSESEAELEIDEDGGPSVPASPQPNSNSAQSAQFAQSQSQQQPVSRTERTAAARSRSANPRTRYSGYPDSFVSARGGAGLPPQRPFSSRNNAAAADGSASRGAMRRSRELEVDYPPDSSSGTADDGALRDAYAHLPSAYHSSPSPRPPRDRDDYSPDASHATPFARNFSAFGQPPSQAQAQQSEQYAYPLSAAASSPVQRHRGGYSNESPAPRRLLPNPYLEFAREAGVHLTSPRYRASANGSKSARFRPRSGPQHASSRSEHEALRALEQAYSLRDERNISDDPTAKRRSRQPSKPSSAVEQTATALPSADSAAAAANKPQTPAPADANSSSQTAAASKLKDKKRVTLNVNGDS